MGTTNESRITDLETPDPRQARGAANIWVDGTDPMCSDEIDENGYPPRFWATRAAAEAWWAEFEKTLDPIPEGEVSVVWLDMNGDKTAAKIKAGLQEKTRRQEEHDAALARQQQETLEELEERRRRNDEVQS